jgi:7 transmembrane sweet-taste receptor of 3 GCPR/Periplasmic binding protein
VCRTLPTWAEDFGVEYLGAAEVPYSATKVGAEAAAAIDAAVAEMQQLKPDLVMVCGFPVAAEYLLRSAHAVGYMPQAFLSTPLGSWSHVPPILGDYQLGSVQWHSLVRYRSDPDLMGDAANFVATFQSLLGYTPVDYNAFGAIAPLLLVEAVRNARSLAPDEVQFQLGRLDLATFYGRVRFSVDRLSLVDPVILQALNGTLLPVGPPRARVTKPVFPEPTWQERVYSPAFFDYTSEIVIAVFIGLAILVSLFFMLFVVIYRHHDVIRASSPLFCLIILLGSIFVYCSIFCWMLYQK